MKFCSKCGKELLDEAVVCPNCGCSTGETKSKTKQVTDEDYLQAVSYAKTMNICAICLIILGAVWYLFLAPFIGGTLLPAAIIIALIPKYKLRRLFKNSNNISDKKEYKTEAKTLSKRITEKNKALKFSLPIAIAAAVCWIALVIWALFAYKIIV